MKPDSQEEKNRHEFLSCTLAHISLSPIQARVRLPKSDLQILTQPPPMIEVDVPALNGIDKLSIHLPLPHIAGQWGVAAILHRLEPNALLCVLNLLLIERSILVIGSSSDIVTSCTCALLALVHPFKWASTFMPLLQTQMLDFVNSPVPFIIGMVAKNDILEDLRVKEAMKEGLSVVNLTTGSVQMTTEAGIKSLVQRCAGPR